MKEFIVAAEKCENPNRKKWWEIWKKRIVEEVVENEKFRVTIKYNQLTGRETRPVLFSDKMCRGDGPPSPAGDRDGRPYNARAPHSSVGGDAHIAPRKSICYPPTVGARLGAPVVGGGVLDAPQNKKILLRILPDLAKSKGLKDTRNCRIAYVGDEFDLNFLIAIAKICKRLTIFSDNKSEMLIKSIFAQTGMIIEMPDKSALGNQNHDFLINCRGEIFDYHDKKQYKINLEYKTGLTIPVSPTRLTNFLIQSNLITLDDCSCTYSKFA